VARAGDGFIVGHHGFGTMPAELKFYGPPWQTGADASIAAGPGPMSVAADRNGERVAVALGKELRGLERDRLAKSRGGRRAGLGYQVALSPDGRLLACGARERTLVVEVDSGRNLATLPGHPGWLAFTRATDGS